MEYQNLVIDFVERTKTNLELVERLADKEAHLIVEDSQSEIDVEEIEAYEVTQLINSLLGLIVLPQQHYFNSIPKIPLNQLEVDGWPKPLTEGELPKDFNNLNDLMRYVRNSIAHFHIEFASDDNRRISGIKIWNRDRSKTINWTAYLRIDELRLLIDKFTTLISERARRDK